MVLIEEALTAYLKADPGVSAIVGTRIYPRKMPQAGQMPALVYTRIVGLHEKSLTGSSGLAQASYQLDCNALDYATTRRLAEALRMALDCQLGVWSGIQVQTSMITGDFDASYEDVVEVYRAIIEAEIWYEEPPANVLI